MAIRTILKYPDERLRTKAAQITDWGASTQAWIDDLIDTFRAAENCAALAATQIDLHHRIVVIGVPPYEADLLCLVNPVITRHSENTVLEPEGCMSVPGGWAKVKRAEKIDVEAFDRHGQPWSMQEVSGFLSRCIQHELDHLDGVLFLDHLNLIKRQRVEKQLTKATRKAVKAGQQ